MRDRFGPARAGNVLALAVAAALAACGGEVGDRGAAVSVAHVDLGGGTYQGCYTDGNDRALPMYLMGTGATVETCIAAAREAGYRFAGLQWYGHCFAGNTLLYALDDEAACNTPCNADPTQTCGGSYHNSVWTTTVVAPGQDLVPGDVIRLSVVAGTGNMYLTWMNPGDPDLAGALVVRSSAPVTFVPTPGVAYPVGSSVGGDGAVVAYDGAAPLAVLTGLPAAQAVHLKVFAFDAAHQYAPGVAASATVPVAGGTYQGCFTDGNARALPAWLGGGATVESCIEAARAAGYRYAGVQFYGQCFAGNTLAYTRDAEAACNTRCSANPAETCGGSYHNSIWSTALIGPGDDWAPGDVLGLSLWAGGTGNLYASWINPADEDLAGVIVVRSSDARSVPVEFVPKDGASYAVGTPIGNDGAVVAYAGVAPSVMLTGLSLGQTYHFEVFAFDAARHYGPGLAASATIPVPSGAYQGCWTDSNDRALPEYLGSGTIESCIDAARAAGYAYAGVQFGGQCFGGNVLGYARLDDAACAMPCGANPAETSCGGSYANAIWATGGPWAYAGPDVLLECPATREQVEVPLHGWSGFDPDGSYLWAWSDEIFAHAATGASTTITVPYWGTYDVALQVTGPDGTAAIDELQVTVGDTIAPRTFATLVGVMGEDGFFRSAVDVTLTSKDDCTGVKEIHWTVNDGPEQVERFAPTPGAASAKFTLSQQGTYDIRFWAVDDAGRRGQAVDLPPIPVPQPSGGGGNYSAPPIAWVPPQPGPQVYCSKDGVTYLPADAPITIAQDTILTCGYAAPASGNVEPAQTQRVVIDLTAPVVTLTGIADGATYALGLVPAAGYQRSDAGSGILSEEATLTGGDPYGLGDFTYTVTVKDRAGNETVATATYHVVGSVAGLEALVRQYRASGAIWDQALADELLALLASAASSTGSTQDGFLKDFAAKVQAQSGKKIAPGAAAVLVHAASYVSSHN